MGGRKKGKPFPRKKIPKGTSGRNVPRVSRHYLLEEGSLESLQNEKDRTQSLLAYYWNFYSELAFQRNEHQEKILNALRESCKHGFKFKNWQRAVKYKYGLHPFSTVGSLSDPGGRFNFGDVNSNIRQFPALYMAEDKATALQEALGQSQTDCPLTSLERALTNPQSETIFSISGNIDRIFDLRDKKSLEPFLEIIKHFTLSDALLKLADKLGEAQPVIIQESDKLLETLLDTDWRVLPSRYDVPGNPQIFGHLLYQAQIEGVIYPSKFTGKNCIALFPHHFQFSTSYLKLDDETPHPTVPKRLDATNWKICDLTPYEVLAR